VLEVVEEREALLGSSQDAAKLLVALAIAGVVGYLSIPWLLAYLRSRTMAVFIVYRLLLAALLLWLLFSGQISA